MIAYNFDPVTHEYTGRETAPENPKRPGEFLMPANSTQTPPPEIREGHARIWTGSAWTYTEDHRGETIWQDRESGRTVNTLGPIPEGWSITRPEEPLTKEKLSELIYAEKCKIAYGGITLEKDGTAYLFATDPTSISMCNAMMLRLSGQPAGTPVSWKVYADGAPVLLSLTKSYFELVFSAGMLMINEAFTVEGELNTELAALDGSGYETFRQGIAARFGSIEKTVQE